MKRKIGISWNCFGQTEIDEQIALMKENGFGATFICSENRGLIGRMVPKLAAAGIPQFCGADAFALNGAFLGYGVDYELLGKETANIVADILGKMGRKLYYFHKDGGLELDFLIRYQGECVPVECKAVTGNAQSLRTVMKHPEKYNVHHALKFGDYNIGRNGGILTLPMYMAFLITEI